MAKEVLEKGKSFALTVNEAMVEKSVETRAARSQVAARVKTYFREGKMEWEPQQPDGNSQQREISQRTVDNTGA